MSQTSAISPEGEGLDRALGKSNSKVPLDSVDEEIQKFRKAYSSIAFGSKGRTFIRIYDKINELQHKSDKRDAFFDVFEEQEHITRFEVKVTWEALKEFPTPDGKPILSMDDYQKHRQHLFKHAFSKIVRIPKERYDRSSTSENDPRWDIVTDGISCPPLFRDKNYTTCKQSVKKRTTRLVSQALSIVAQISIHDNAPINHNTIPSVIMNHLRGKTWIDKYYDLCAKALQRRNEVSSGLPTVLEHLLVKQALQDSGNDQYVSPEDIQASIDIARANFAPKFTITCDYSFRDKNSDPLDMQKVVSLCSYGHSLFKYDFKHQRIWKSMTYRAAWMSYLLSPKASTRYVRNFPDGHIKLVDLRDDIIELMKDSYYSKSCGQVLHCSIEQGEIRIYSSQNDDESDDNIAI